MKKRGLLRRNPPKIIKSPPRPEETPPEPEEKSPVIKEKSPIIKQKSPVIKQKTPVNKPTIKGEIRLPPLESTGEVKSTLLPKLVVKPTRSTSINDFYKAPPIPKLAPPVPKLSVLPPQKRPRSRSPSSDDSILKEPKYHSDRKSNRSPVVVRIPTEVSNDPHAEAKLKLLDDNHC